MLRSEWESLFAGIDEENLPPLSSQQLGFGVEIPTVKTNMAMDNFLLKVGLFHCHVNFRGCTCVNFSNPYSVHSQRFVEALHSSGI